MRGANQHFRTDPARGDAGAGADRRRHLRRPCDRRAQRHPRLGRLSSRAEGSGRPSLPSSSRNRRSCGTARACSTRARPIPTWPTSWSARTSAWSAPTRSSSRSTRLAEPVPHGLPLARRASYRRARFSSEERSPWREPRRRPPLRRRQQATRDRAPAAAQALQGVQGRAARISTRRCCSSAASRSGRGSSTASG